jgi:hypothetical protein
VCAKLKKVWAEWWPTVTVVIGIGVTLWFVAHDEKPSECLIKLAHELAWPILLFLLVGYYYRESLTDFIARMEFLKGAGVELAMRSYEERKSLEAKLQATKDTDEQRQIQKLLKLSPEALQLLGNLVAVGLSQNLNLGRFKGPQFEQARGELLFADLAVRDGQYYRPTREGVGVLSAHIQDLTERLAGSEKKTAT